MIAVMGPTGAGKSRFAEVLAARTGAQLINADAFQVYRGFDIGTNKSAARDRYELLDVAEGSEQYGVGEWIRAVLPILEHLYEQKRHAVFVGGTGFYIRALFEEYADMAGSPDPELRESLEREELDTLIQRLTLRAPEVAARIDLANPIRVRRALEKLDLSPIKFALPPFQRIKIKLDLPLSELDPLLTIRLDQMLENGWIEEVKALSERFDPEKSPGFRAIGYRTWVRLLEGKISLTEGKAEVLAATRAYAKRQRTWLRKEPGIIDIPVEATTASERSGEVEKVLQMISAMMEGP